MAAEGATILIVDDEPPIRRLLRTTLAAHEYRVVEAANGAEALSAMRHHRPDLVLLDLGLPDVDGLELIGRLRGLAHVPIVVLSSRGDEAAKVKALDSGADDYVTKPFNPVEVVARVKAVLRRVQSAGGEGVLRSGPVEIDQVAHIARVVGADGSTTVLNLTLTEFRILVHLARTPSRVFSRGELVDACLPGADALDRTVDSHVSKLRRKLEDAAVAGMPESVRGVGYRLVPAK